MTTNDRLIFKQNNTDKSIYAYIIYQGYETFVGSFNIGDDQFDLGESACFLTKQDMIDIVEQMTKYSADKS